MKKILLSILLATFVFCGQAFSQDKEPGKIFVTDMVGLPSDPMVFGLIPWETLVYAHGGGSTNMLYLWLGADSHSTAFGKQIRVEGKNGAGPEDAYSVVVGPQSESIGYGNTLIGHMTSVHGDTGTAVGRAASVESWFGGTAIGYSAKTLNGYSPIAIGVSSVAGNSNTNDIGSTPVAIGHKSVATSHGSVAIGNCAESRAADAIQIGPGINSTPRSAKIGNAKFVDVASIAATYHSRIDSVSDDPAAIKAFVKAFLEALTVPYVLPESEPVDANAMMDADYRDMLAHTMFEEILERLESAQTASVQSLETKAEDDDWKSTWHDFIQYVVMAIIALVAIIRKKKQKQEDVPEPEVTVESKPRRR